MEVCAKKMQLSTSQVIGMSRKRNEISVNIGWSHEGIEICSLEAPNCLVVGCRARLWGNMEQSETHACADQRHPSSEATCTHSRYSSDGTKSLLSNSSCARTGDWHCFIPNSLLETTDSKNSSLG
jgi:hypothetical protein